MPVLENGPKTLRWGRAPSGEFFIAVVAMGDLEDGRGVLVMDQTFILTQEELDRLQSAIASSTGLILAHHLP